MHNPTNFELYTKHSDTGEGELLNRGEQMFPDYYRAILPHQWIGSLIVEVFSYKQSIGGNPTFNHNPYLVNMLNLKDWVFVNDFIQTQWILSLLSANK